MKKINITLIALCAALLVPLGCKKNFLTQTNTFQSTADASFQKSSDVVGLVNAIYDSYQSGDYLKKSIWYYANFQSHDWFNDGGDIQWNNYSISPTFAALYVFWTDAYIAISRANAAFGIIQTAIKNGVVTQDLGNRLQGEAYFLRGMTYYYLAGAYGSVPLVLKPGDLTLHTRSSQTEIFTQVVADMKQAEALLTTVPNLPAAEIGRATKEAAYAYEGSAQMWLGNYTAALTAFNNPDLNTNCGLLPNFVDVGEFDHQNSKESVFAIQFDIQGSQSWDGGWQNGGEVAWIDDFSWPDEVSGFGYDYANPGLRYSFQPGDLRQAVTVIGPNDPNISPGIIAKWGGIKGYQVIIDRFNSKATYGASVFYGDDGKIINTCGSNSHPWYGQDGTRSGYYCAKKWRDPNLTGANGTSAIFGSQNQMLMRFAEVLLSRAECKIRTGDNAGALADIKKVRDRAFGGSAPAVMQDGFVEKQADGTYQIEYHTVTDPMQMVLSEYRHELTGDYSLFFDLRRAGKAPSGNTYAQDFIHNNYNTVSTLTPIPYPYGPTADGKAHGVWNTSLPANHDILPIPQQAIGLNPNLGQNPGY